MRLHPKWRDVQHLLRRNLTRIPASRRRHLAQPPRLDVIGRRVTEDLYRCGVAQVSFHQLIGRRGALSLWTSLADYAHQFAHSDAVCRSARRLEADDRYTAEPPRYKSYIIKSLEDGEQLASDHCLLKFALHSSVLGVVNTYLGLWSKLQSCNLWHTIACDAARPRSASQRWHRDPEDLKLVKVFIYFSDVDPLAGPLEYIPASRFGGRYAYLWRFAGGSGVGGYPPQKPIEEAVPPQHRYLAAGPRGTVVFCDTSGLHRGGFLLEGQRLLGNWTYVTPASLYPRRFSVANCCGRQTGSSDLSAAARYAIT